MRGFLPRNRPCLVAALQSHSAPVQKITIIPRTSGALGYTMQVDKGNHYLMTKEELLDQIATLTGGRAAEEVVFHTSSSGASNDIEKATKLARAMITRFGMSDEFGMVAMETVTNQYLGGDTTLACSPETAARIDRAVSDLIKTQHAKAVKLLEENRPNWMPWPSTSTRKKPLQENSSCTSWNMGCRKKNRPHRLRPWT